MRVLYSYPFAWMGSTWLHQAARESPLSGVPTPVGWSGYREEHSMGAYLHTLGWFVESAASQRPWVSAREFEGLVAWGIQEGPWHRIGRY